MKNFQPDYKNMIKAAFNQETDRVPLYEHGIDFGVIEKISGKEICSLYGGDESDRREFFRRYIDFYRSMGYDTVPFDQNITSFLPDGGALLHEQKGIIKTREDFEKYPWDEVPELFYNGTVSYFRALTEVMPEDMRAMGGPGNGIFECVQDLTGFSNLCYISVDDPDLYQDLFKKVGETNYKIWERFLKEFADTYAISRFGDDLGYKMGTMLKPQDIKDYVVPEYTKIIELIHSYNKPFMYHSCGNIFDVMDDIIDISKINAKHSNEDVIAPFGEWVERYGDKIGNFGGIDVDVLCQSGIEEIKERSTEIIKKYGKGFGGLAVGSGNSIAHYVPVDSYIAMIETFRLARGE
jgi:uroporphyrinogen decarboxylase